MRTWTCDACGRDLTKGEKDTYALRRCLSDVVQVCLPTKIVKETREHPDQNITFDLCSACAVGLAEVIKLWKVKE